VIPDRNLRIALVCALDLVKRRQLEQLRRTNPDGVADALAALPIPGDRLAKLRALEWPIPQLVGGEIASLVGLERCPVLDRLRLRAVAPGIDLSPLARLQWFRELAIAGARVERLDFVARLTRLRTLALDGPIADLAPLGALAGLESLALDGITASDVEVLLRLRDLSQLRLRWADGAPGPTRDVAQAVVDALADRAEVDIVWPCGDVRPHDQRRRARNLELEARIFAEPEDPDAYLVYADWLQAEGDPFGQLIIYDHHLAETPTSELAAARRAHFALHQRRFLGDLAESDRYTWRLGYIRRAEVAHPDEAAALWRAPAARFLTALCVHGVSVRLSRGSPYAGFFVGTLLDGVVKPLRELEIHLGRPPALVSTQRASVRVAELDVAPLWRRYPNLREVVLDGAFELGEIALPEATRFELRDDALSDSALDSVSAAAWPRLEELVLAGLFERVDDAILDATAFPSLRRLRLEARWPDAICVALARARVVEQLVELEVVSPEGIGNEGARALVRARARFAHLHVFDVTVGKVNPADAKALGEMLVKRTPE
jgi:uncharacterized protein (TIGR02996 family)